MKCKIDIVDFSKALIESEDLDPIYVMLYRAELERKLLKRWLISYWMSYHAGVSSKLAEKEGPEFWAGVDKFQAEKWPRGRERRHFKGKASEKAINWLKSEFPEPERAIKSLYGTSTFPEFRDRITKWPLWGPWAAYKCCDMVERVLGWGIEFTTEDLGFYESPAQGGKMFYPQLTLKEAVLELRSKLQKYNAPPGYDRPIDIQEVETCLCKGYACANGKYYVGQDTKEIGEALHGWGPLAEKLSKHLPG